MEDEVEALRQWIRKRQAPPLMYFEGMLAEQAMAGDGQARDLRRLAWNEHQKGRAILYQHKQAPGRYKYYIAKKRSNDNG